MIVDYFFLDPSSKEEKREKSSNVDYCFSYHIKFLIQITKKPPQMLAGEIDSFLTEQNHFFCLHKITGTKLIEINTAGKFVIPNS